MCVKVIVSDLKNETHPHHRGEELARWMVKRR
jgi:hypothetical protein